MEVTKSKKVTALLIVAVAGVWGLIIYRLFIASAGDEVPVEPTFKAAKKEKIEDYTVPDTFKLSLNYRDPFLGTEVVSHVADTGAELRVPVGRKVLPPQPSTINWSFIRYSGYIVNPTTKKTIALVSINNQQKMLSPGESSEGVRLVKSLRDSIQIVYEGKSKYIKLSQPNESTPVSVEASRPASATRQPRRPVEAHAEVSAGVADNGY